MWHTMGGPMGAEHTRPAHTMPMKSALCHKECPVIHITVLYRPYRPFIRLIQYSATFTVNLWLSVAHLLVYCTLCTGSEIVFTVPKILYTNSCDVHTVHVVHVVPQRIVTFLCQHFDEIWWVFLRFMYNWSSHVFFKVRLWWNCCKALLCNVG